MELEFGWEENSEPIEYKNNEEVDEAEEAVPKKDLYYRPINCDEEKFLNHSTGNDVLYTYLYANTYYHQKKFYLPKASYVKHRPIIQKILNLKTPRSIDYALKKLIEKKLIQEDKDNLYFSLPKKGEHYHKLEVNLLKQLSSCLPQQGIRVYLYLVKLCGGPNRTNDGVTFSLTSLKKHLGYYPTTDVPNISKALQALQDNGFLEIKKTKLWNDNLGKLFEVNVIQRITTHVEENKTPENIIIKTNALSGKPYMLTPEVSKLLSQGWHDAREEGIDQEIVKEYGEPDFHLEYPYLFRFGE